MAYRRLFKVSQDVYITKDDVNEMIENERVFYETMIGLEHHVLNPRQSYLRFGEHTSREIPRALAAFGMFVSGDYANAYPMLAEGGTQLIRMSVGRWRIPTSGLMIGSVDYPHAHVEPVSDGSAIRRISSFWSNGSATGGKFIGFEFSLYEWDTASSSWEFADFAFSVALSAVVKPA